MASNKKIPEEQKALARQETRADTYKLFEDRPSPREVKSQVAQQEKNQPGTRKDVKLKMHEKLN